MALARRELDRLLRVYEINYSQVARAAKTSVPNVSRYLSREELEASGKIAKAARRLVKKKQAQIFDFETELVDVTLDNNGSFRR